MTRTANPYNWQHHEPAVNVPRALVATVADELLQGGAAVVIGGRGMGKSVLLHQVRGALRETDPRRPGDQVRVLTFPSPPQTLSATDCLRVLARQLGEPLDDALTSFEVFERYFERHPNEKLILLYDEFDRYARPSADTDAAAGRAFFNDLETSRRSFPPLGILAVGTLGVFVFRDVLGSSFLSRAARFWMPAFSDDEARLLARPFEERGTALPEGAFDMLDLASGGNPALLTYGLQHLWPLADPTEHDVAEAFRIFQDRYGEFLRDVTKAFSDPSLSQIPHRAWELVRSDPGPVERSRFEEICRQSSAGALDLTVADVLQLLQAAGLIRVDGSAISDDPITVSPSASLLGLPEVSPPAPGFAERLWSDLELLLARLFASSVDFFRPGARSPRGKRALTAEKRLVPESVFAAFLRLGFGLLGWQVEREAQEIVGRTDLKLRRNGSSEIGIVEVKIWGRRAYEEVQRQVESYWTPETEAGAVVMLTDAELPDWLRAYRKKCLADENAEATVEPAGESPLRGRFSVSSSTPQGLATRIRHFLLHLPRSR